jgi:hybrid polyketide synthase/nonribosomal peptide synthetase ACE1
MARKIEESLALEAIDWEGETALPDPRSVAILDPKPLTTPPKVVLITGAGGFLGRHVSAQLVANDPVSRIHCIALLPKRLTNPQTIPISPPKIVTYAGAVSNL